MGKYKKIQKNGFTIVELLVVVVVIAILASITIVAYNGVQNQARLSVLKSDLLSSYKSMEIARGLNDGGSYPTTIAQAGIRASSGIELQLSVTNSPTENIFCITAVHTKNVGVAYYITQEGRIDKGKCNEHTTNPGFINLVANPSFETGGALATTRTNLIHNPRMIQGGTANAGFVYTAGQTGFGGFTSAGVGVADTGWKGFYTTGTMPYSGVDTPIAMRFWAKANASGWIFQNLTGNISILTSWAGKLSRVDTGQQVSDIIGDNVAREYILTFTVPAAQTTSWQFGFKHNSSTADPAKTIAVTGVMAENATAPGEYFDGSSSIPEDGLTYAWSGTANGSQSVQQGQVATGFSANRIVGVITTRWAALGQKSLVQVPTSTASNDNYTDLINGAVPIASLKPSTMYTFMATVRLEAPLTGALAGNGSRSLFVHLNGTGLALDGIRQAPNVAGTYDLRATFTTPAVFTGYNTMRLYHGGYAGSGYLWWDKIGLVEGNYTGPYFE